MTQPTRPPGPGRTVTMGEIRSDPLGFLMSMALDHGPVTYHETERDQVYMVSDPELVADVMMRSEDRITKEGAPDDAMLTPLLGEGLLTTHGDAWARQRQMTQPMFHRSRVEAFAPMMVDAATDLAATWLSAPEGAALRIDHDLTGLALSIVVRAVVGGDISRIGRGFGIAVDGVNAHLSHGDPRDTPDTETVIADAAGYPKAARTLDGIVRALIAARRAVGPDEDGTTDLLQMLLEARDPHTGEPISERELRDQVMTMIMAGHETTAKALTWTLYLLDSHPDVGSAVRDEIRTVVGDRAVKVHDLVSLPLCRSVIQEAMRLYPPIWIISRRAAIDEAIGDYTVPAGTLVCVSPWVMHRHPAYWKDPDTFDPARFAGQDAPARGTYLPFGSGTRMCIGRGFAMMEAQLVLATICGRMRLRLVEGHVVVPQALVTLRPQHGMLMTAHRHGE